MSRKKAGGAWSDEKPTAAGWYFVRPGAGGGSAEVVQVTEEPDGLVVHRGGSSIRLESLSDSAYIWAGPVPEPPAPEAEGEAASP